MLECCYGRTEKWTLFTEDGKYMFHFVLNTNKTSSPVWVQKTHGKDIQYAEVQVRPLFQPVMNDFFKDAADDVVNKAKFGVPVDTRKLEASIKATYTTSSSGFIDTAIISAGVPYAFEVEKGRPAGNRPSVSALSGWAKRHGVNPFALAKAIERRGIEAQPFLEPALQAAKISSVRTALINAGNMLKRLWG